MSKTPQEIVETYGKTVDIAFTYGTKAEEIGSVASEKINEVRYYFDGALYTSVMRCMEIKLIGNFSEKIKKDYLIRAMNITVNSPDGDYFNISLNNFHVAEEPEYNADQNLTSIITYDNMYLTMQPYDMTLDWTNGITLKSYLTSILGKLGMQYNVASLNLMANADKLITSEKFIDIENDDTESAYTYRDVLDEIAKASGVSFCYKNTITGSVIDSSQLYAVKPTESGIVIDESNLKSVTIGAEYGPVKGVVLSREPQEDNIYYPSNLTEDDTAVKISNVEIIEDAEDNTYREKFIQGIYSNVVGTQYYLYDLDSFGILILNFGDIFTIKACDRMDGTIGEEKSYKTILMRTDITIGDGISEKSKLEAPQATSTDYSAASTTDKTLKKTMLKVDKQNQKITAYIADTDGKYSLLEQSVKGINSKIEDPEKGLKAQLTATAEKATAAYSKAETVKGQVDGVTTQIESINNELSGLDDTIANKVTTEVQKDTTIEILAGKVNSEISGKYVTKTDYDDEKKNWVLLTDYNTRLTQTDQSITASAEKIQTLEKAGYITETQAKSMIELQSDDITLKVEKNLKIGARNILLDSACFQSFTPRGRTSTISHGSANASNLPSGKYKQITFSPTTGEKQIRGFFFLSSDTVSDIAKIKPNTTYTLSFHMLCPSESLMPGKLVWSNSVYLGDSNYTSYDDKRSVIPNISTTEWQKYIITFTTPASVTNFQIQFLFENCDYGKSYAMRISSLKLEEGNIATDWTPSAEDIDQSVKAQIDLCVKTDENGKLVSEILIESNKLRINTDNFKLDGNGNMTCVNADITGKITATSGTIGGWNAEKNALWCTYSGNRAFIQAPSDDKGYYIAVGDSYSENSYSIKFALLANGEVLTPEISTMNSSLTISTATSIKNRRDNFEIGGATYTIKGDTNYRDFIRSKGGFVIEAGNGSNSISLLGDPINLLGSEIYVNGEISLGSVIFRHAIDSTKSDTAYKYLVVFEKDGRLGFASL